MDQTSHAMMGGRSRLRLLAALSIAALASPGVLALTASPVAAAVAYCDAFSETTPGAYPCLVPAGVTSLTFIVAGGDGGNAYDLGSTEATTWGGHGARIAGSIAVTPGESLDIIVGGDGADGSDTAGGGGGYSSIARGDTPVVVAGAGGGAGYRGGDGGSGTGGGAYDGGGWGGPTGMPGMFATDGSSGGVLGFGGDGGDSIVAWTEDVEPAPIYGYAGDGGSYGSETASPYGGDAEANTHGGGGGGAFGAAGGLHDVTHNAAGEYALGATYGAGGNGGYDGGGGGGGYGGGGGGGGGHTTDGQTLNAGGGGGGGSSLIPSGASVSLSTQGAIVSLSGSTTTTIYVVPDDKTVQYGRPVAGGYTFVLSSTADGSDPVNEGSLTNYSAPSCGSTYTTSTPVADSPLVISCGGGTNAGTPGSADGVTFDYSPTDYLTITKATLYVVPGSVDINQGAPVPGASSYTYLLYTDAGHVNLFTGTPDVAPTCGSAYTTTTTENLAITCGGGTNAGTAGSDANFTFDYTATSTLRVNNPPVLGVTLRVKGAVVVPVILVTDTNQPVTLQCSIDGGDPVTCTAGWKSIALAKGPHTLAVTATDSLGASSGYLGTFTVKSGKVR